MTWQPSQPFSAIVFDCDGTLSGIEGIDELAHQNGVGHAVSTLTADAMGHSGMNIQLYQQRLDLVQPSEDQVIELANRYYLERAPEIERVIAILTRLKKTLFVISAGLTPAVVGFATKLGFAEDHIFSVDIDFDPDGNYIDFDHSSPLVNSNGKQSIILEIEQRHPHIAFIGDGLNDLSVRDIVARFIGYGGIYYRKHIESACEFYLTKPSMLGILPLLLTPLEVASLSVEEKGWYDIGLDQLGETTTRSSKTKQSP